MAEPLISIKVDQKLRGLLLKTPEKVIPIYDREFRKSINESVVLAQREIVIRTPVLTGTTRKSISNSVSGSGIELTGVVGTPLISALPMEFGTRPHIPPPGPIELWIRRRGISWASEGRAQTVEQMAFFITTRQIGQVGLKARRMFKDGFDAARARILKFMEDAQQRVLIALERD